MSHGKIRSNKYCENCNSYVPERYCSNCGQENTETRQSFHYLITHFIEDFVHYDASFWRTIKKLFFKPGELTIEYLSGKRKSSVNPVKLYIFVSFITFFTLAVMPSTPTTNEDDESFKVSIDHKDLEKDEYESMEAYEAVKQSDIYETKFGQYIIKTLNEKNKELNEKHISKKELGERLFHNFFSFIPKTLFLYMPIFAFLLWLIYNKKRWWFFDHGIFTLHYFSMLLMVTTLFSILNYSKYLVGNSTLSSSINFSKFIIVCYTIIYFYLALKRIYKQGKLKTFLKGSFLIGINSIFILIVFLGLLVLAFYKI